MIQLVAIWLIGWFANRLVKMIARRIEASVDDGDDAVMNAAEKRGHTIAQLVRCVGRAVLLMGFGLLSLNLFVDIKPLPAGVWRWPWSATNWPGFGATPPQRTVHVRHHGAKDPADPIDAD